MNFNSALKRFLFRIGSGVRYRAKQVAPYKTGNLKKDIQVFDERIDSFSINVGNTKLAPYAKFVYFGTRPHVIKPKKMKALANKKSGQIFGKSVNHPGTKANPYFEKAKEQLASDVSEEVVKDIKIMFKDTK